jgi:hypothetical protein
MTTIATTSYTEREEAISIYSDQYKSAYGIRPRNYNWDAFTLEEIYAELDSIQVIIDRQIVEEEIWERASVVAFNELIEKTISLGAGNRETALRWLFDGATEEFSGYMDYEHFIYQQGIMHTKEGDAVIQELIEIYKK